MFNNRKIERLEFCAQTAPKSDPDAEGDVNE